MAKVVDVLTVVYALKKTCHMWADSRIQMDLVYRKLYDIKRCDIYERQYMVVADPAGERQEAEDGRLRGRHLTWTNIHDRYSGPIKISTHLDHLSNHKTASDTNWSNTWTHPAFIISPRRDGISIPNPKSASLKQGAHAGPRRVHAAPERLDRPQG